VFVYNCPELFNPTRPIKCVNLHRYAGLHEEGKRLIGGWFGRAWSELENGSNEVF
jgi:hypothetical protein